jgi:hypothetical protein
MSGRIALSFPQTMEKQRRNYPTFDLEGRMFVTVPDDQTSFAALTPPPVNFCASSSSTPPATTNPPDDHPDPHAHTRKRANPRSVASPVREVLRHHKVPPQDSNLRRTV